MWYGKTLALSSRIVDFTSLSRESLIADFLKEVARWILLSRTCTSRAFITCSYITSVVLINILARHTVFTSKGTTRDLAPRFYVRTLLRRGINGDIST